MRGQAPYGIAFRWVYGPPLPAGLDPVERKAMIEWRARDRRPSWDIVRADVQMEQVPASESDSIEGAASQLGFETS
jgi:hypothetical protein